MMGRRAVETAFRKGKNAELGKTSADVQGSFAFDGRKEIPPCIHPARTLS
jgi:hypothetical protein